MKMTKFDRGLYLLGIGWTILIVWLLSIFISQAMTINLDWAATLGVVYIIWGSIFIYE